MQTDVSLRQPGRTIIVDTKYYREPLQVYYSRRTVRSEHLYQLFAYLKNLEGRGGPGVQADGVLLYPTIEETIDLALEVAGHIVRVRSIDLDRDWAWIHCDLLALLEPVRGGTRCQKVREGYECDELSSWHFADSPTCPALAAGRMTWDGGMPRRPARDPRRGRSGD